MQRRNALEAQMNAVSEIDGELSDISELAELADAESDTASLDDAQEMLKALRDRAAKAEVEALLSGEADANNAFVEIHPGAGGTESNDWASMLLRMYVRWAEQHGYKVDVIEQQAGDEAGIKSATIHVKGHNAYGWLKTESGVHRLVRISPYDSNARRHTSFSSVWVYPEIDDRIEIEIDESDCRVDTFRASGAGGQHVNKTDSAIRITHHPTGIVVSCQNERSQHKNRASAMKILKSRLYDLEIKKREEERAKVEDAKMEIGFGSQIRSYVLHPYRMVKDHRTRTEVGDADSVLVRWSLTMR